MADSTRGAAVNWIASYPKSGNTWLRCLLEAYRGNGHFDLNDMRLSVGDMSAIMLNGVSPVPLGPLNLAGELLIRPAGLLNMMARYRSPFYCKTHFANVQCPDCPPCIPPQFTERAVYILRDPRDVITSFSRYFGYPLDIAIEAMRTKDFVIGNTESQSRQLISSWSNHVASWTGESRFPVHVIRYEDLVDNTRKELNELLAFLGWDIDEDRIDRAVNATEITKLQKIEAEQPFVENKSGERNGMGYRFFNGGGSRWRQELSPTHAAEIEHDHREIMRLFGYLDDTVSKLTAVS